MKTSGRSFQRQQQNLALAGAVLSLIGLALSAYLAQHYYELRSGTAAFKSFCNVSSTLNCDTVAASPYAHIVPGLPIASLAGGWFIVWILFIVTSFFDFATKIALKSMKLLGIVGLVVSALYLVIMKVVIGSWCLFCLGIDGVNLGLFVVGMLASQLGSKLDNPKPSDSKLALQRLGTVAVIGMLVGVILFKTTDPSPKVSDGLIRDAIESTFNQTPKTLLDPTPALVMGNPNGKIVIHEFSDLQCPACKMGAQVMNTLLARYPKDVKIVYRAYPLDMSCNTKVQHALHPFACESARVAYCAQEQGRHQEVIETIFERQSQLASGKALEWAVEIGLDKAKLDACLSSGGINALVARDLAEGDQLGVASTPTFFINGYRVEGPMPPAVWDGLIEHLLK